MRHFFIAFMTADCLEIFGNIWVLLILLYLTKIVLLIGLGREQQVLTPLFFFACLWWVWRCCNSMCLSSEHMSLTRLSANIMSSVKDINLAFSSPIPITSMDPYIRWNNNNFDCAILNVDGSCIGSPARAGFGGLIRNSAIFFLAGFLGFLPPSSDILQAELTAIYYGLSMAKDMGITQLVCYSDSHLSINIINGSSCK